MTFTSTASTRKARRKEERANKKQSKRAKHSLKPHKDDTVRAAPVPAAEPPIKDAKAASVRKSVRSIGKKSKRTIPFVSREKNIYASLPPEIQAAMKRDDDEIVMLEQKLGIISSTNRSNSNSDTRVAMLNNEYSKKESFGEDFGSFLDEIDHMVERLLKPNTDVTEDCSDEDSASSEDTISESEKQEQHATPE